jgi:transcriptional regulator with PAS, ATPase and Fis domain
MATTGSNIMILGESGTGKDVFAQAIHNASNRKNKPFIALNCGAMPRDLIESELFGYESGAFTGARKGGNIGKFELAHEGTIFLDEIGEMPLDLQSKLLRVVEQKQIMRIGGTRMIDVDVKIIAATNANVWEMIEHKKFRADLFYRLSTMRLNLPPLRERKSDIVPLAEFFIRKITAKIEKPNVMRLTPSAKTLLTELAWYGNVRELQNLMECIVQLYPGDMIQSEYIMENVTGYYTNVPLAEENEEPPELSFTATSKRRDLTRDEIVKALDACGKNRSEAAKYLRIARRTLYRKMEEMDIPLKPKKTHDNHAENVP